MSDDLIAKVATLEASIKTVRDDCDDHKRILHGEGKKDEPGIIGRTESLERDRNLLRWFIAICGGIAWPFIQSHIPWLKGDRG